MTAYRGSAHLLDYSATKGAIVSFTRSLAHALVEKKIRVSEVKTFGNDNPMGRPGEPVEIAPSYVFLASNDASFMTGQVLHPNGGEMVES